MWSLRLKCSIRKYLALPGFMLVILVFCGAQGCARESVYPVGRPEKFGLGANAWIEEGSRAIDIFEPSNVARDDQGNPYLIYGAQKLYIARRQNAGWKIEPVKIEEEMNQPTIAVDNHGQVHIAFFTNENICYAVRQNGDVWQVETVREIVGWLDNQPNNRSLQLFINDMDKPSLLYENDFDGSLTRIQKENGTWAEVTIIDPENATVDLSTTCVDAEGKRHIFIVDHDTLYHLDEKMGSWSAPDAIAPALQVPSGLRERGCTSGGIDSDKRLFVLYYTPDQEAAIATRVNGAWKTETIGASPSTHHCTHSDIAMNSLGETWVAFMEDAYKADSEAEDSGENQQEDEGDSVAIRFGRLGGDGPRSFEVAYTGPPIRGLGMRFDGTDVPAIFFQDSKTGDLLCRRRGPSEWITETIDAEVGLFHLAYVN